MSTLVGQKAPSFKAPAVVKGEFKEISLDDYKGKWVVLFFYPLDFTFVCPTEINGFADRLGEFQQRGAEVIGVSIDSQYSHLAWMNTPRNTGDGFTACARVVRNAACVIKPARSCPGSSTTLQSVAGAGTP